MGRALRIGGITVRRGQVRRIEVPIARLPAGTFLSLPVRVLHGRSPGPRLWLDAALHGDEINGVEIIREVLQRLDPARLRGTVVAVPIVNVFGFVAESRYLPDRRDLNRSFPGSPTGSLAARVAHLFMTEIVGQCTHGIDLHTGSDDRTNLPHVRADLGTPAVRALAEAFGTSLTVHNHPRDGSLRQAAGRLGIPCIVYEAGEARRFNADAVDQGVEGVLRVLAALKMIAPQAGPPSATRRRIEKTRWVRATQSGILRLDVRLGETVARHQVLGTIADAFGEEPTPVRAHVRGIVLGLTEHPLVHRGDAVVHLAATPARARPAGARK